MDMRRLCRLAALAMILASVGCGGGDTSVRGYTTQRGTPVALHHRSAPNNTETDNWSAKGNTNPYTGKLGTSISKR